MKIRVRQDGVRVIIERDGILVFYETWERMKELATTINSVASKAEEWDKALQIAGQNALLIRSGAPFGLTFHPVIQKESLQQAIWGRALRKFLPNRIKGIFGTPSVIHGFK